MSRSGSSPTAAGIRRAVRSWTRHSSIAPRVEVPGASEAEQRQLAVLGGLAFALAKGETTQWPEDVARWAAEAPPPPDGLLDLILRGFDAGIDSLAEAYNASISATNRRRLGTVFTPDDVVEYMLDLADAHLSEPPAVVIDPGAGVGAFTLSAARRWPTARIIAVDINPVTLGLLGARLARERLTDAGLREAAIELVLDDYLDALPALLKRPRTVPALVLGNPPYTRTQALSPEYKERASGLTDGMITSGHANLAMLFQALTLAQLRPGDASCMVLPASMLFTRAARDLRGALWGSKRPVVVDRWPATGRAFIGREVQAAVLLVGPESAEPGPVKLARVQTTSGRVKRVASWSLPRDQDPPANWYSQQSVATPARRGPHLGELVVVRRGVATGANKFFFLSAEKAGSLPPAALTPAVPTLRRFSLSVLDRDTHAEWIAAGNPGWLLALEAEQALSGPLEDYVAANAHLRDRYLCRQRPVWWAITDLPRPTVLLSPLSSSGFKVVENRVRAVPSNNLLGIWTTADAATSLADWLRSRAGQAELHRVSRRYQGGSHKIEPGDLRLVRPPRSVRDSLSRG